MKASETSSPRRRRVEAVFSGQWPDRIPICEQAFASSVASAIMGRKMSVGSTELHYEEACAWMGGESSHEDFVEKVYQDTVALHRYFDFDIFFPPWRMAERPTKRLDEYSFLYGNPEKDWTIYQFDPASKTYGVVKSSRAQETGDEVIENIRRAVKKAPPPSASSALPSLDPFLARAQRELGSEFMVSGGSGMAIPMKAGWLEATVLEPELMGEWLDLLVQGALLHLEAQRNAGIRLINGGGDFAFNTGPIYSPVFFKKIMAPRWKRVFDKCRELGLYYIMRSDGNLWPVADSLFGWAKPHAYYECDYDAGMRFGELRARFPELVLIGNVSCSCMMNSTPDGVRARVTECIRDAAPRVVAATANSILHGTPPENVIALYEAAKSYGGKEN